ncbi:autotransporter outer membrane beta-barrel domain-containing protein [Variovorax rhizosphaerae]|uniref:Autotransporter outer membrane beta-barrel domain-containing protein n=1 Tax=Variovorax rhizosphaerae TaxID=1836200 RepID=A0ABU8WV10_9BURK
MNKHHRVIWNESTGTFAAVPETAKGRSKSSTRAKVSRVLLGVAALLGSGAAMAVDTTVSGTWTSIGNSNKAGQTEFNAAGTNSLSGTINFEKIPTAYFIPWSDAIPPGYVTAPDVTGKQQLVVGAKSGTVAIKDPITGNMQTLPVYGASSFTQGPIGTGFSNAYFVNAVQIFPRGAKPYVDVRLATVKDGTLNIDLRNSRLDLGAAKQTDVVYVDGTTAKKTEAVWRSGNYVRFGDAYQITATPAQTASRDQTFDAVVYKGTFNVTDSKGTTTSHTVTNLATLTQYNDWLVREVAARRIAYADYEAFVKLGYGASPVTIHVMPTGSDAPLQANDPLLIPAGNRALLRAVGPNATARIANPVGTTVEIADGVALWGEQGATVINDGRIAETAGTADVFVLRTKAKGFNNGVITTGYASTAADASAPGIVYIGGNTIVDGEDTALTNRGVWNVGAVNSDPRELTGFSRISVSNKGLFTNEGAMNLGSNNSELASPVMGVLASGNGRVINTSTGVIYLGRGAAGTIAAGSLAGSLAAGGADTTVRAGGVGVQVQDSSEFDNQGLIVIGTGMQATTGILVKNATSAIVTNSGTIDIKGARPGEPLENQGIWVVGPSGSSVVSNTGTINLSGVNGVGIKVTNGGKASSSGTINVGTSTDPTLPNYGLWAEGAGSNVAVLGNVNLSGEHAIGVHARSGGTIDIRGGDVNFGMGTRQVGFFADGSSSVINIETAPTGGALDVSTEDSTLFLIEDGATIHNRVAAPLIASGKGSTAIRATGAGSTVDLDNTDITVSGVGATALKVEGGATGSMTGASNLKLSDGAIAVAIDDNKYDLAGEKVGSGHSNFINSANISTTGRDVTVFQVKNGAELTNGGNIDVAHGTAIEVTGAGSSVGADARGILGTITVHDGKAGFYVHDGGTLTTSNTVTVDGSATGVLVGADSGRVVLTDKARIIGLGGGYGLLVVNQGVAGNVLLDGTFLEMRGSGAALMAEHRLDPASHGKVLVSSTTAGKGVAFSLAGGGATSGDFSVGKNFDISVTGNGSGVYANSTGNLTVASNSINVTGTGQGVLVKAADTVTIARGAVIRSTNAAAVLVAGAPRSLVNKGVLEGVAGSDAVRLDDSGHAFENSNGGAITGNVSLGDGTNTALLADSSITGEFIGGTGQDTVTLRGNAVEVTGRLDGGVGSARDTLVLDDVQMNYHSATSRIRNFENLNLSNASVFTLKTAIRLDDNQADTGIISIDAGSTLAVAPGGAFALNNKLAGTGTVTTDTAGQSFDFTGNVGSAFAGTVKLGDSRFALDGVNTATLQNATLELGEKSVTTVGTGNQTFGGLKFSGGTAIFDATLPDAKLAASTITVATLDASGAGSVQVNVPAPYIPVTPTVDGKASLMEQDDGNISVKLVNATTTNGSGGALVLRGQDGVRISDRRSVDIAQGGQVVAKGDYDFRLTTQKDDGLYVNYGLTQLDLQAGQTLTLQQREGTAGNAADQSARITGAGQLAIDAGDGAVSLSNTSNDYTGATTVQSGTLRLAADNALGRTSALNLSESTQAQLAGTAQAIGQLQAAAGSTLALQGGTLDIANGGRADGSLTGGGSLNVKGGVLLVSGSNAALSAATSIASGAVVVIRKADGLGSGAIANGGKLVADVASNGDLVNAVSGIGDLVKTGAGALSVGSNLQHTGRTDVASGTLVVGSAATPGALGAAGASPVTVTPGAVLAGAGVVNGQVNNSGTVAMSNALAASASTANSTLTLANGLVNSGTLNLAGLGGAAPGNVLVVKGNYVGNNGHVVIRTVMGNDSSATDKLVIDGGRASGSTELVVKSAGGIGAQTRQGIRVVETRNGGTTVAAAFTLDPLSDGYRAGRGTLAAGAYDYNLVRGGDGGNAQDWYLSSTSSAVITSPPGVDASGSGSGSGMAGGEGPAIAFPVYRPEVGAYLANRQAALQMSVHTLHDRQGHDGQDRAASGSANGWLRVVDTTTHYDGAGRSGNTHSDAHLVHGGADLVRFGDGAEGSIRIGAMGMYGSANNRARNAGGLSAHGDVDGYSLGVYATWYGNPDISTGPYADAWVMGGSYHNKVRGQGLVEDKYNSRVYTASLEAGYSFKVLDDGKNQMYIEPQAQVVVQNYRADNHLEATGTFVSGMKDSGVTTRLGVRIHGSMDNGAGGRMLRPFAEFNWWHGSSFDQSMQFNTDRVTDRMPSNRYEVKLGLQGNLTKNVSAWGSIGGEVGGNGYRSVKAQAGIKYSW